MYFCIYYSVKFLIFQMENPWNIKSIYDLQYFNCPECLFKNHSKQELINHAYDSHPEAIEFLKNVNDKSLMDIVFPWQHEPTVIIKTEQQNELNSYENYKKDTNLLNTDTNIKAEYDDFIEETNESINMQDSSDKYKCSICFKGIN